jgi:hypothetical protein
MSSIIIAIILTALFVNGLQIATEDGMIGAPLRKWLDSIFITQSAIQHKPKVAKVYYPILYCVKCMPSIYGTIICLLFLPFTWNLLYAIPVVIVCSVALSAIIHTQYL